MCVALQWLSSASHQGQPLFDAVHGKRTKIPLKQTNTLSQVSHLQTSCCHRLSPPPLSYLHIVLHGHAVQGVQHGMASAVGGACAAVGLPTPPIVQRLPAKGALVDLALLSAREGQAIVLQLNHSLGQAGGNTKSGAELA